MFFLQCGHTRPHHVVTVHPPPFQGDDVIYVQPLIRFMNEFPSFNLFIRVVPVVCVKRETSVFYNSRTKTLLKTMRSLQKEYGNVVKFYVGTKPQIFLFGAEGFEKILSSSQHLTKGFQYNFASRWLGTGLLTGSGSKWQNTENSWHLLSTSEFWKVFSTQ